MFCVESPWVLAKLITFTVDESFAAKDELDSEKLCCGVGKSCTGETCRGLKHGDGSLGLRMLRVRDKSLPLDRVEYDESMVSSLDPKV